MNRLSGNLAIIACAVALGLGAGLGGAWLGLSKATESRGFSQVVSQLLEDGKVGLSPEQHARIEQLRVHYETDRRASGAQLQTALVALAQSVVQTPDRPEQVDVTAKLVDGIVHERRMASIGYISDARAVLEPAQRAAFDKAFLQVVANDPSYSQ
jgi:hypothetical protein